jgi:Bacterial SH3 domain
VVRTNVRRPVRLRSNQYGSERWKPSPLVAVVFAGLLVGAVVGLRGRFDTRSASLQEHYLLLVSDLHAQGAPLSLVRERLISVGFTDPPLAILSVADPLATSPNKVDQQAADQLHQFAQALSTGADVPAVTTPATVPTATVPTATVLATATSLPVLVVDTQPTPGANDPTPVPIVVATPVPTEAAPSVTTPAPPPAAAPAAPTAKPTVTRPTATQNTATIKSPDRQPVFYRKQPQAKATAVGTLPYGTKVTILGVVQGQAVDPGESRWYKIAVNGHEGYVYAKYVVLGG